MAEVNTNIATIFQQIIPNGKKALQDSHKNLAEIADYCERQYVSVNNTYKSNDKQKALEETRTVFSETKQYATQSLASVAYQIHAMAASVLDLLDSQANQLSQMNSDISYISNVSFTLQFLFQIIELNYGSNLTISRIHPILYVVYGNILNLLTQLPNISLNLGLTFKQILV